jgi:ribosomal protein S18 acetylase RimI-like enzyme
MVRLAAMTQVEFDRYMETAVEDYAQSRFKCGDCAIEEARAHAADDYKDLLPQGLDTPRQHVFSVLSAEGEMVGMLWLAMRERYATKTAYIYDIRIDEAHRGKGHAAAALAAAESIASSMGAVRISLNVMSWNHTARRLYERSGYGIVGIGMSKELAAI